MKLTGHLAEDCPTSGICPQIRDTDTDKVVVVGTEITDPHILRELDLPSHEAAVAVPRSMIYGQRLLTIDEMLTWIGQHHTRDLVRLETRTGYAVTTDGDDYHRYLRGEDVPNADAKAPWLARLAKDTASGHIWRKVHLVCGPLTDYQRYEFEWGFAYNVTAGEQIRILEVTDPNEAELIAALGDFSVLDGKHVLRNHYDTADQFLGGEVIYASEAAALSLLIGRLWDAAEPFESWWNRHPQYHRAHSAA